MLMNIPCRIVLFAINMAALLVATLCIALGSLMIWGRGLIGVLSSYWFMPIIQKIAPFGSNIDILRVADELLKTSTPGGVAILVVGVAVAAISIFGFAGACFNLKIAFQVYEAVLGAISLAILVIIILLYAKPSWVTHKVLEVFETSVHKYKGMDVTDINSLIVGLITPMLQCCGYNSSEDFTSFKGVDSFANFTNITVDYPLVCCHLDQNYLFNISCLIEFTPDNSNIDIPCKGPLEERFKWAMRYIVIGMGVALGVMVILILFTGVTMCVDFV